MTAVPNLNDLDLPEVVGRFSLEPSGLIVFAGATGTDILASAHALVEHIAATSGRRVVAVTPGSGTVQPGTSFGQRSAVGREDRARAIREEAATAEAPVILVENGMDSDRLWKMVKAATQGSLVIATMESERQYPYVQLIDLIWAAEDWGGGFRRDFEAALYAVVTQTVAGSGRTPNTDLHLGSRLR